MNPRVTFLACFLLILPTGFGAGQTNDSSIDPWGKIDWGSATNGVSAGLQQPVSQNGHGQEITVFLRNFTTNLLMFIAPDDPAAFQITVADRLGRPVPRTTHGRKLATDTSLPRIVEARKTMALKRIYLRPREIVFFKAVDLSKYFVIRGAGPYTVVVETRLETLGTNWVLQPFALPKIKTKLDVR